MNNHPINLVIRFLLELLALAIMGYWAWHQHGGWLRFLLTLLLPLAAATVWGVFRVPGDPGPAPVAVSGIIRLLIEALYFGSALWMLCNLEAYRLFWWLLLILLIHYAVSYDRVLLFLGKK